MANTDLRLPVSHVMPYVTMHVRVTGLRTMRVRLWLACQLLRLAAWTAGCGIEITTESKDDR